MTRSRFPRVLGGIAIVYLLGMAAVFSLLSMQSSVFVREARTGAVVGNDVSGGCVGINMFDDTNTEVARIKKTFEGIAKTLFTTADNYVVRMHRPLEDPLLSLVVASALTVDTALKQDSRGFS